MGMELRGMHGSVLDVAEDKNRPDTMHLTQVGLSFRIFL